MIRCNPFCPDFVMAYDRAPSGSDPFHHAPADSVRVVQFTDTHLYHDPDQRLLGVRTQHSFEDCLHLARAQHWPPDLTVLSGDLVHDGSEAGYRRLRTAVVEFETPVLVLPGNHDEPERMQRLLAGEPVRDDGIMQFPHWQVIALNSAMPDTDAGRLDTSELQRLERQLEQNQKQHALVILHHPPVAIGSAWMDRIGLQNGADLFEVLGRYPQVRAVLCGHIHQELDHEHQGVRVLATPSTCIQFAPRSEDFGVDPKPPGYRWLVLRADGGIDTGVRRLAQLPEGLELESGGY